MGIGDEIMASGRARVLHEKTSLDVVICARSNAPRWEEIWEGVPFLKRKRNGEQTIDLIDGPGKRPYYNRSGFLLSHRPVPGTIAFSAEVLGAALETRKRLGPYVLLEPHIKGTQSGQNKLWPFDRWKTLAFKLMGAGVKVVQCMYQDRPALPQVHLVEGGTFHQAAACIRESSVVVTCEGGYHHAAAALNSVAVVLWPGMTRADFLGYTGQKNIRWEGAGRPCGNYAPCEHCRTCMDRIGVDEVFNAVMEELP